MNKEIILRSVIFIVLIVITLITARSVLALNLVIHIPEKYLEVVAGDRLAFELEMKYPENPTRKDLRLTYQIKKGNEIISETKALKAIETQSSFLEYLPVPETVEIGTYTITNKIQDYENLNEEVSANFRVIKSKDDLMKYFYILASAITMVGLLVIVQFLIILRIKKNEV
jgi:hypothetical protein